jgi:putative membrane protein
MQEVKSMHEASSVRYRFHLVLLATLLLIFFWSAIEPADRFTWVLEVLPAVLGVLALLTTFRRFPLTGLLYLLIWLHAVILLVGGHYTYAEVPLFNWLRDTFDLQRNYYDRVGHFAQGFVPALIAREILLRTSPLQPGKWLFFIVTCICLAISAGYEFIEWWVAVGTGTAAEAFLGTQGDVWDTQWDMFLAFCGAIIAQLVLGRCHDQQLQARGFSGRGSVR